MWQFVILESFSGESGMLALALSENESASIHESPPADACLLLPKGSKVPIW